MEKVDPALREAAFRVFGNEVRAMRWLTTPVRTLGGKSPADADLQEALDLLARVAHGFSA
ncbi:MbcA/ParS/Xre antitoxin family protein [Pseudomonas inefficax]|uniref:MbcA/ParS/Xre antitoxin family protein n=1 Tax=Pseudomonas inefficax TaxID=2078786 RepID=UPI004046B9C2